MATIGEIIDYVLESCGKADVGEDRASVQADIIDLITTDLPADVGGFLLEGTVELQVGYTGTLSESGVYDLPATLQACKGVLATIEDVSLGTKVTPFVPDNVMTMADDFYSFFQRYGPAGNGNNYGQPQYALLYADQVHLRPIPKQTGTPIWFGTVVLHGAVTQDFSTATEATVIERDKIVPTVRAGAVVLYAVRSRRPDVAETWGAIFTKRKSQLRALMSARAKTGQPPARDF